MVTMEQLVTRSAPKTVDWKGRNLNGKEASHQTSTAAAIGALFKTVSTTRLFFIVLI